MYKGGLKGECMYLTGKESWVDFAGRLGMGGDRIRGLGRVQRKKIGIKSSLAGLAES